MSLRKTKEDMLEVVLLAPTRKAYAQLSALITRARRRMPKGEYELSVNDFGALDERMSCTLDAGQSTA